jgi:hypothetical protein
VRRWEEVEVAEEDVRERFGGRIDGNVEADGVAAAITCEYGMVQLQNLPKCRFGRCK